MSSWNALLEKFFELSHITIDELSIQESEPGIFNISLSTPDSGMVIGPWGKNIIMFANILKLLLSKHLEKRVRVHFDVNGYQQSKQEKFLSFIESKIGYVKSSWGEVKLPFLTSYERKKIHGFIADKNDPEIFTKSEWEGKDRRLFICKKPEALTIDIDGNDI